MNTFDVDHISILNSSTLPGVSIAGVVRELRHRARMIPSVRFSAVPHSLTSTSFAVKSVSGADEDAYRVAMIGPVIATFGSDDLKQRFLPKTANADIWWSQGFSEPDAGSDLASLRTSAVRDGDTYLVNGQKAWTAYAQHGDWIFTLVRTDPITVNVRGR